PGLRRAASPRKRGEGWYSRCASRICCTIPLPKGIFLRLFWGAHNRTAFVERQRRMGVEPTRGRAERPPSRFEDGETHRGPYTSISLWNVFCHRCSYLSSNSLQPCSQLTL